MRTNGDWLRQEAERQGVPARTLEQVQEHMAKAARHGSALSAARLLLRHGRMTAEAREWLQRTYGQSD